MKPDTESEYLSSKVFILIVTSAKECFYFSLYVGLLSKENETTWTNLHETWRVG